MKHSTTKISVVCFLLLLFFSIFTVKDNYFHKVVSSLVVSPSVKDDIYNSNTTNIENSIMQLSRIYDEKVCFRVTLSNYNFSDVYDGHFICNKGDFDVAETRLVPPTTNEIAITLDNSAPSGLVTIIVYPGVTMAPFRVVTFILGLILVLYYFSTKPSNDNDETSVIDDNINNLDLNATIFLKNKRLFPINIDSFGFATYKDNYCEITLITGKKERVRTSLGALSNLLNRETTRPRRDVLLSNRFNYIKEKNDKKIIIDLGEKKYEV